jgi:hypothetical protein
MEGPSGVRRPLLEVGREFAGSRLEEQIRIRIFELLVPVIRRGLVEDGRLAVGIEPAEERVALPHRAKGA